MEIRFIERGTPLTVIQCTRDGESIWTFDSVFHSALTIASFLVEDETLYTGMETATGDTYFTVEFLRNGKMCAFKAKLRGNVIKNGLRLTQLDQLSDIKEVTRRVAPRIKISAVISVYETEADHENGYVLMRNLVQDISGTGICLLSNTAIGQKDADHHYLLEFVINRDEPFLLPARLVRRGDCPQTVQFKYDYGFLFDYTGCEWERERLVTAILNDRLTNRS